MHAFYRVGKHLIGTVEKLVSSCCNIVQHVLDIIADKRLEKDFHKNEGPFVKALDTALASFHVHRQAYYSGTFVGNHVHRALKVNIAC